MNIYIYLNMYRGRPDVQIKCKFFLCFIEKCIFFFYCDLLFIDCFYHIKMDLSCSLIM